jgi:DNA-binding beta-propeller fold protein YncE
MSYDLGCTKGPSDDAFDQIEALLVSPDGAQVYTGAYNGDTISVLDRDATTGALTFASCLTVGSGPGCTKVLSPSAMRARGVASVGAA